MKSVPKLAIRSQGQPRVTQVEVERTCGHVEVLEVRGDPSRSAFLDNARLRVCGKCYRESQTERDAAAVAEGKRCALEGSERQIAWASSVRQKRAVEFGNAIHHGTAWVKAEMARDTTITLALAKARTKVMQQAIGDLFAGKVTWALLDQDGNEVEVNSDQARFWIDTRELEARDFIAAMLPQYRWEAYREWEPMFRDEAVDDGEDAPSGSDDDEVVPIPHRDVPLVPSPAQAPSLDSVALVRLADLPRRASKASEKLTAKAKADLFDDDDIPF